MPLFYPLGTSKRKLQNSSVAVLTSSPMLKYPAHARHQPASEEVAMSAPTLTVQFLKILEASRCFGVSPEALYREIAKRRLQGAVAKSRQKDI